MHSNYSNLFSQKLIKAVALGCLLFLTVVSANAQRRNQGLTYGGGGYGTPNENGWGISFGAGYEKPTGDMGSVFSGAPVFHFSVIHNWGDFTFNATIGYASFRPKLDTTFIYENDEAVGYIKYGHYSTLQIYAGAAYNISIADQAKLYLGFNLGSYYNHLDVSAGGTDPETGEDDVTAGSEEQSSAYIAPKIGLNFILSSNIMFGIEAKHNYLLTSESGTGDAYDSGYKTDVSKTYTVGASLTFLF